MMRSGSTKTGTPMTPAKGVRRRRLVGAALILALAAAAPQPGLARAPTMSQAYAAYARGDYVKAGTLLMPLAARGDARAQALLGFLYEYGKGVPQDFQLAADWYECSAQQGEATGQYLLGLLYNKGRGVPQDVVLSQKWLILAAARASRTERDAYTRMRDAVATKMSTAQRALAQQLALEWYPALPVPPVPYFKP